MNHQHHLYSSSRFRAFSFQNKIVLEIPLTMMMAHDITITITIQPNSMFVLDKKSSKARSDLGLGTLDLERPQLQQMNLNNLQYLGE